MSQTIEIIIQIKEAGAKAIDNINKNIQRLNDNLKKTNAEPILQLIPPIEKVSISVTTISKQIYNIVHNIKSQTRDLADDTSRIGAQLGKSVETFYSRLIVQAASVALGIKILNNSLQTMQTITSKTTTLGTALKDEFFEIILKEVNGILGLFSHLYVFLERLKESFLAFNSSHTSFLSILTTVGNFARRLAIGTSSIFFFKIFFSESTILLRRLVGQGMNALTPLERITRSLITIDEAIHVVGLSGGETLKTLTLGILTFYGPFSGIIAGIPFLNSVITSLLNVGERTRLIIFSFFGSARAKFQLIFYDVKQLLLTIVPILQHFLPNVLRFLDQIFSKVEPGRFTRIVALLGLNRSARILIMIIELRNAFLRAIPAIIVALNKFASTTTEVNGKVNQFALKTSKIGNIFRGIGISLKREAQLKLPEEQKNIVTAAQTLSQQSQAAVSVLRKSFTSIDSNFTEEQKKIVTRYKRNLQEIFAAVTKEQIKIAISSTQNFFALLNILEKRRAERLQNFFLSSGSFTKTLSQQSQAAVSVLRKSFTSIDSNFTEEQKKIVTAAQTLSQQSQAAVSVLRKSFTSIDSNFTEKQKNIVTAAQTLSQQSQAAVSVLRKSFTSIDSNFTEKQKKIVTRYKRNLQEIFAAVTKEQIKIAISSTQNFFALLNILEKRRAERLQNFFLSSGSFTKTLSQQSQVPVHIENFREKIKKTIITILDLKKISSYQQLNKIIGSLVYLINISKRLSKGRYVSINFDNSFKTLFLHLALLRKQLNKRKKDLNILDILLLEGFSKISPDRSAIKVAFAKLDAILVKFAKKGKESGDKFNSLLADGLKGNQKAKKAIAAVAELIAAYFPMSPAKLGPLRFLVTMGMKIVSYLALGIRNGFSFITDAIGNLVSTIFEPLNKAAELREFSRNLGISVESLSSLEFAATSVGSSLDDIQFIFQRLNETLSNTLTFEELQKFRRLGIDIEAAARAQEPVIALFQQFSDSLKKLTPGTLEWKEALELLGVTTNTKVINLLRLGSEEIRKLQKQGVELGTTISPIFAENALRVQRFLVQLTRIKDTIINDVLAPILPQIELVLQSITEIIRQNRVTLNALLTFVVKGMSILVRSIGTLISMLFTDLPRVFQILREGIPAIITFVFKMFDDMTKGISTDLLNFVTGIANLLWNVLFRTTGAIFNELSRLLMNKIRMLMIGLLGSVIKVLPDDSIMPGVMQLKGALIDTQIGLVKAIIESKEEAQSLSDVFVGISKEAVNELEIIAVAAKGMAQTINDNTTFDKFKARFQEAMDKVKGSIAGTPLESLTIELEDLLDKGSFDALVKKAQETQEAISKSAEKAGQTAEKVSDNIIEQARRIKENITAESQKAYWEVEIALERMKNKIAHDDLARYQTETRLEMLELEKKQAEELEAFKKSEATIEQINEFKRLQRLEKQKLEIELYKKGEQEKLEVTLKNMSFISESASQISTIFSDLYDLSKNKIKEFFYISKMAAIAQAIINVAEGVTKALAMGGPFGIAQGALISAAGAVQIAKITAETLNFAEGGLVPRIRSGKDSISAQLTAGEYVQPVKAVAYYGIEGMEAIRRMAIPREFFANFSPKIPKITYSPPIPKFFADGLVLQQQKTKQSPIVNIVNFTDKQMVADYLASNPGQQMLLNAVGNNRAEFKRIILE